MQFISLQHKEWTSTSCIMSMKWEVYVSILVNSIDSSSI